MDTKLATFLPVAGVELTRTLNPDPRFLVIRASSEHGPCSTLAFEAVTHNHKIGLIGGNGPKLPALALRDSLNRRPLKQAGRR